MTSPSVDDIQAELATILDPEMPINIVDLGIVHRVRLSQTGAGGCAEIDVIPTFIGCPALDMIRDMIRTRIAEMSGIAEVRVRFLNDPPWSVDRISPAGREALREFGVTTPAHGGARPTPLTVSGRTIPSPTGCDEKPDCPFCGASETRMESAFGPTRCKMIFYCDACRNTFEHLKPI